MRLTAMTVATATLTGCGPTDPQFVVDRRVEITEPAARATVTLPLTVTWEVSGFRVTGPDGSQEKDRGYFAVFVDRAPVPPRKDLRWLARGDRGCLPERGCPDQQYLADRQVYTTTTPSITLAQLPLVDGSGDTESHVVTVVLLDGSGRRIGESAWRVPVRLERR